MTPPFPQAALPGLPESDARAVARRSQGKTAKENGRAFEKYIEGQHELAWARRIARIKPTGHEVRQLGPSRPPIVTKSGADYTGTLRGGRHLVVEAKTSMESTLAYSELKPKQVADLNENHALGAVALLLVELHTPQRQRFAVPWKSVPWKKVGRGTSVHANDLQAWRVPEGALYLERL